jgi:uncharacterized membrane protein
MQGLFDYGFRCPAGKWELSQREIKSRFCPILVSTHERIEMDESRSLTVVKAITYRILVTFVLSVLSWIFTEDAAKTSAITVAYTILATVVYYFHERFWMIMKNTRTFAHAGRFSAKDTD